MGMSSARACRRSGLAATGAPAGALLLPALPCLRAAALAAEQRKHARKDLVSAAGVSRAGARA